MAENHGHKAGALSTDLGPPRKDCSHHTNKCHQCYPHTPHKKHPRTQHRNKHLRRSFQFCECQSPRPFIVGQWVFDWWHTVMQLAPSPCPASLRASQFERGLARIIRKGRGSVWHLASSWQGHTDMRSWPQGGPLRGQVVTTTSQGLVRLLEKAMACIQSEAGLLWQNAWGGVRDGGPWLSVHSQCPLQ